MADFPRFLIALLWWTLWGPKALCARFIAALQRLVPDVNGDTVVDVIALLDRHLATLRPEEQRRLTYVIAREVFTPNLDNAHTWDAIVRDQIVMCRDGDLAAALAVVFEREDLCWRAVAHAAVVTSGSIPELRHAGRRASGFLRTYDNGSKRLALAELLAPEHANAVEVRRMLGCPRDGDPRIRSIPVDAVLAVTQPAEPCECPGCLTHGEPRQ